MAPGPSSGLVVHPVAGADRVPLDALTDALIQGLLRREVATIPYDVPNRYRLSGSVELTEQRAELVTLLFTWQLSGPSGQVEAQDAYLQDTDLAAYQAGDPQIVAAIAQAALPRIAALIGLAPGVAEDVADPPDLGIAPIRNAPGDGAEALTAAMISELKRLNRKAQAGYQPGLPELEALVSVTPSTGGRDQVHIIWLIRDAAGQERGRLEQKNTVPTNRLAQRWGVVAKLAASAAAPGIVDLLNRLQAK